MKTRMMMCAIVACVMLGTAANAGTNEYATWYTLQSSRHEGTSGITAGGRLLNESAFWCALPSRPPADSSGRRAWGRQIRITNTLTGKSIVCEQWDYGPGKGARARGVCVDLTPVAFLALGGKFKAGRMEVKVEVL